MNTINLTWKTITDPDLGGFLVEEGRLFDADDYAKALKLNRSDIDAQDVHAAQDAAGGLNPKEWLKIDHTIEADDADLDLFNSSWTDACGMLLNEKGGCQRAPRSWGVSAEETRDGVAGREFYLLDSPNTQVFVPLMSAAHKVALNAILDSLACTGIVTLEADQVRFEEDVRFELMIQCEDNVETDGVAQYWGTDDEGDGWRVHVRLGA